MKFKLFVLKLLRIRQGPWMIPVRDHWIFVDRFQQVWEIRETAQPDTPLQIFLKLTLIPPDYRDVIKKIGDKLGLFDARYGNKGPQDRPWNGSPTFYKLLEEMAVTHDKKSHDYASNSNPCGNYHFAGQLAQLFSHSYQDMGFVGRLGEKLFRLANLEGSQKIAQNESIEDTERDLCVIMALWMADRIDRRTAKLQMIEKIKQQTKDGTWEGFPPKPPSDFPINREIREGDAAPTKSQT